MTERRSLPARRPLLTQKVKIAGRRTLYIAVHDVEEPRELFLRVSGPNVTPELIACYDIIARLTSLALQNNSTIAGVGQLLLGTKFEPGGPVTGHSRMKFCTSPADAIARHLLIEHGGRNDLAHAEKKDGREATVRAVTEMID